MVSQNHQKAPVSHNRPQALASHNRLQAPASHNRPQAPASHNRPQAPASHNRPQAPASHNRPEASLQLIPQHTKLHQFAFRSMSDTKEKHVDSSALGCTQCRRVRYAKACTGLTTVLSRYQEWAVPFLKLYSRYQVTLQNEMVAKVSKIGMQFQQFLALTDVAYFRAACRFKISIHPCACHLCTCMSVAKKNPTRASHKIVDQPTHSRSLKGKEQGGKNNTRWIKARQKKLQHVQAITGNTCGMQGPHRHSLTIHSVEKCHGTYELRKRSHKGMPEAVSTDIYAKSHSKRQQKKCKAVLVEACAHCKNNTSIKETHTQYLKCVNHTKYKNGIHYHADDASPLRGRCIGGRPAPVWTSISSTSPSSFSILSTPSAPVCFLCSCCAPDYVPFACQKIYSAKCSGCKRANCNQCGNWEGSSFFCKWCFDEDITPSVEAIQSWKAAQQTCKAIRSIRTKILPCRWVGHARKSTRPENLAESALDSQWQVRYSKSSPK